MAAEHDETVALISHVPQVMSSLLASRLRDTPLEALGLAGQGLRDTTRIAASAPGMWVQILAANAAPVVRKEVMQRHPEFATLFDPIIERLDDALVGMSTGETKDFSAPLAGGDKAGQSADCTVTVQSVKERELPEVDDDFAQMASEFDTAEELRADVAKQAEQSKKFEQGIQARDKVLDHLLDNTEIPLPEGIVEAEIHQHLEQEGRLEDDEHRAEVDESTRKTLTTQFLLDALATAEEIEVGQPELIEYLVMQSQQYGMDPNQFAQLLDQQGQVEAMVGEVARRKALAAALDKAKIVDADGNAIDLDDIVPESERAVTDVEDLDADDEGTEAVEAETADEQA